MRALARKLILLCLISLGACDTIQANLNTGFDPAPPVVGGVPRDSLAVQRFTDDRPPRVYSTAGREFLVYVPFIPYVARPFERLDESALKAGEEVNASMPPFEQYTYPASMARAIAIDLDASGLFRKVDYVGDRSAAGYRYVLSGTVRSSPIEEDVTSYCLGIVGVYFWILPIPIGQTWASITLDLVLTDTATRQQVWRKTLTREYSKWFLLYTSGPSLVYGGETSFGLEQVVSPHANAQVDRNSLFSWHFELLRQAMQGVPQEIARAIQSGG